MKKLMVVGALAGIIIGTIIGEPIVNHYKERVAEKEARISQIEIRASHLESK